MKKMKEQQKLSIPMLLFALAIVILVNIGLTMRVDPMKPKAYEAVLPMTVTITSPVNNTVYTAKDVVTATATVVHTYPLTSVDFQYSTRGGWKKPCVFKTDQDVYTCTFTAPFTGTNKTPMGVNDGFVLQVYAHDVMTNTLVDSIQLWSHK